MSILNLVIFIFFAIGAVDHLIGNKLKHSIRKKENQRQHGNPAFYKQRYIGFVKFLGKAVVIG